MLIRVAKNESENEVRTLREAENQTTKIDGRRRRKCDCHD